MWFLVEQPRPVWSMQKHGEFQAHLCRSAAITLPVGVSSLVAADWDQDGKTDLAALGTDGRVFF